MDDLWAGCYLQKHDILASIKCLPDRVAGRITRKQIL